MVLSPFVVVFGPILPTGFPELKSWPSGDARRASITPGSRLAARGFVVQHVDAVELRVVVAAVLAVAADAVLVAQHLLKLGAHLVTALARLHVRNLARRSSLEAGRTW
jgi:hypothetical protein